MDQLVLFALLGLGTGALIAGIGLGRRPDLPRLGRHQRGDRAEAMAAGYAFYSLRTVVDTPLALLGTLAFTIALGVAVELLCFRPLRTSSPLARLVSSLGVLLTLQAGATLIYGTGAKPAPSVLPHDTVQVSDIAIPADRFWLAGIVMVVAVLLAVAYRYTRFGLATRAASENEVSAILAGLGARELSLVNTVLERGHRRRHGRARVVGRPARRDDAAAPGGPGARRGAVRALHVVQHHRLGGAADRHPAVAPLLRLDAELVPDRQGRRAARHQRAADVPDHRPRALRPRLEPADARRARRAAPAGGARGPSACCARRVAVVVGVGRARSCCPTTTATR